MIIHKNTIFEVCDISSSSECVICIFAQIWTCTFTYINAH